MFVVFVSLNSAKTPVSNVADVWISFSQFSTSSFCVRTGSPSGSNAHAPGSLHGLQASFPVPIAAVVMFVHLTFAKLLFYDYYDFFDCFSQLISNSLIRRDHASHLASSSRKKDPSHGRQLHHPARNAGQYGRNCNLLPNGCGLPRSNARHAPQRWRLRYYRATIHPFVDRHDPDSVVVAGSDTYHRRGKFFQHTTHVYIINGPLTCPWSVSVPITGMYAVVVAIDWFIGESPQLEMWLSDH
jgi:hypothetical protein